MSEMSDVSRRVRAAIEQARLDAADRRVRLERDGAQAVHLEQARGKRCALSVLGAGELLNSGRADQPAGQELEG